MNEAKTFDTLMREIRSCRVCETATPPLPHPARPICIANANSKIRIISQAPGNLADQKGMPFYDPSGVRLRDWLGVDEAQFYNVDNFAITPVGLCFPGYDKNKGDLPPRRECAPLWQGRLDAQLTDIPLTILVGGYAQKWVLGKATKRTLTQTVQCWRDYGSGIIPLPHPSWRNTGWIKKHEWFADVLDHLKERVADLVE